MIFAFVGPGIGFLVGMGVMYFFLSAVQRKLLDYQPPAFRPEDVRQWIERNKEIEELNRFTYTFIDKMRGSAR